MFLPRMRAHCSQHNLQDSSKRVQCFSKYPNTDDGTRSGQFLRYEARWTQQVLLPIALVLTHLLEHAKACQEWRRRGSPWVILYPSRLLQNKSSVLQQAGSLKTHQHCSQGSNLWEKLFASVNLSIQPGGYRVKQQSKGKRSRNLWT